MRNSFIKIQNVTFSYEDNVVDVSGNPIPAVKDVTLEISAGEYVAVLGHNGSGKSTLAKLLNMILTPTSGKIFIDGLDITGPELTEDQMFDIRRKVGMVFQNPDNQLVATLVEEDVAFGPENLGLERQEIRRRVDEALETVGMTAYANHAPHRLSGGQKQRIAIAGVIAMMPECIVFDESTAMLDPVGRHEVMETINRLNKEKGITIIHITHYMEEAAQADRIVVINDGRVELDGAPNEVFTEVDKLHDLGLEAPQGTELLHELKKYGLILPSGCTDVQACADAIEKLFL